MANSRSDQRQWPPPRAKRAEPGPSFREIKTSPRTGSARHAAGAKAIWTAGPFDAALLDAVMPDVSGWELAAFLRETHPDASLAVVTGADVRGIRKEELARVDAVFRKPVDAGVLDEFLSGQAS